MLWFDKVDLAALWTQEPEKIQNVCRAQELLNRFFKINAAIQILQLFCFKIHSTFDWSYSSLDKIFCKWLQGYIFPTCQVQIWLHTLLTFLKVDKLCCQRLISSQNYLFVQSRYLKLALKWLIFVFKWQPPGSKQILFNIHKDWYIEITVFNAMIYNSI